MKKKATSPYRVVYWLGAGLALLLIGVLVLIKLAPGKQGGPPPDPERTLIWLHDPADPAAPAQVIILEESRSQDRLSAVAFTASADLQKTYGGSHSAKAQEQLAARLGRQIHHRVFLPYSVVSTLVDAAQGVAVGGRSFTGAEAVAYITGGGDMAPDRGARVLLGLAQAVAGHGIDMTASDGFRLARQVDTDIDLTAIPDRLTRWSRYGNPTVRSMSGQDLGAVQKALTEDSK